MVLHLCGTYGLGYTNTVHSAGASGIEQMEIDKCQLSRTTCVSVPLVLLNCSHLSLKSISIIIVLPQGLANQPLSICCVLVTCSVMVSPAFPGTCSELETTGAYTWISNSSFALGILPNELK